MKRIIKYILALMMVMAYMVPLCGCSRAAGEAACMEFVADLRKGDYEAAYGFLAASSRNDTVESKKNRITKQEFVDKYSAIFDALEIYSLSASNVACTEGEIITQCSYTLTYHSSVAGDLKKNFSATLVREDGKWRIEWSPKLIFPEMTWGDTVRSAKISAKRGEILAKGEVLAENEGYISVYAMPSMITDEKLGMFLSQAANLLGMDMADVKKKLDKSYNGVAILKQYYQGELPALTEEQLLTITGIGIDYGNYGTYRNYPNGSVMAHILGYVGHVSEEELPALNEGRTSGEGLYTLDSAVGKLGLEKAYEKELRGKDGSMIYIADQDGMNKCTLYKTEAQDGYDLELTVDPDVQKRTDELLKLVLYGDNTAGAVVVMNPLTGDIQAMSSYPGYDLNLFARGIGKADYETLLNMTNNPLFNRLTQGLYPPGSVFKSFTAAAALKYKALSTDYVFNGEIVDDYWTPSEYGKWIWTPIKRSAMNYRTGPLNMRNAILTSDNIYFANAALKVGAEDFQEFVKTLGVGEAIPFELSVAASQLLNKNTDCDLKLLADSGYGQGEMLLTPLQLASMFSAFANGGDILVPHVVESVYAQGAGQEYKPVSTREKTVWKQDAILGSIAENVTAYLKDVMDSQYNGTGRQLRVKNCVIAGKTGTAEVGNDKSREIAWFAGFRTGVSEADARLVLVMLEVPADKAYSSLKFDIARQLLELPK